MSLSNLNSNSISNLARSNSRLALSKGKQKKFDVRTSLTQAIAYKLQKQLEGEEVDLAPETHGLLKWKWSKKEDSEVFGTLNKKWNEFLLYIFTFSSSKLDIYSYYNQSTDSIYVNRSSSAEILIKVVPH